MSVAAVLDAEWKWFPYHHQLREFEAHCDAPARSLAWHMRTGKSKAVIDKACHLYKRDKIDGVLIFAPNGVHSNWGEVEFPKHLWPGIECHPMVWRSRVASERAGNGVPLQGYLEWAKEQAAWWERVAGIKQAGGLAVLCVNSESMVRADVRKVVAKFIKHRRVFVVFDESDDFGTPGSKRTKMARALSKRCPYRAILSGTQTLSSPLAAWSQFELLEPGALGFDTYAEFEDTYAEKEIRKIHGRKFEKIVGYNNLEDLRERMARWTSVVLREDVDDMPAINSRQRYVQPSEQQERVAQAIRDSFMLEIEEWESFSIGARADRLRKLQQCYNGFVFDEFGDAHVLPGPNPRLDALQEEAYRAPGKFIVWCQYQPDIDAVCERLRACGHDVFEYHGRVSDKRKAANKSGFITHAKKCALVGHPQSCGRGQDFSVASTVIWYSHTFAARFREQAKERATAVGGGNIEMVDLIVPGPDQLILSTVEERIDVADFLSGVGLKEFLEATLAHHAGV